MKTATMKLEITLTFSGGLTKTERNQVVKNFADHIIRDIDTAGIVPDDCEEMTASIVVKDVETDIAVKHNFMQF
jgi:hypothetical protein